MYCFWLVYKLAHTISLYNIVNIKCPKNAPVFLPYKFNEGEAAWKWRAFIKHGALPCYVVLLQQHTFSPPSLGCILVHKQNLLILLYFSVPLKLTSLPHSLPFQL